MGFFLFLLVTATLLIRPAEQLPELRELRLYETLILLCFAFSISSVLQQFNLKNIDARPVTICVFGLLAAVMLSHLSQGNTAAAGETGFEFAKVLVFYVLLVGNITTTLRLRIYMACLGFFSVAFVTLAVLQYHEVITLPAPEPLTATWERPRGNEHTRDAFVKDMEYDPVSGQVVEFKRLRGTGIFRDPNDICLLLTMGLFIAIYGLTDKAQSVFRLVWLGPILLFVYALYLTQSRGGILSLLAGSMAFFYTRFGWRATLLLGAPMLPAAVVFFGGRMASFSTSEGTGQSRIQIWSDGISALLSAPLFGVGMNELGTLVGKAAHNSFLSAYAELGLFGGTIFFGAFFFAAVTLARLLKNRQAIADPELRRLLPFLAAMLICYSVGIMTLSRVDAVPTYLLLGLVTATASLAAERAPKFAVVLDVRLLQRLALASLAFVGAMYMFVRVFKA